MSQATISSGRRMSTARCYLDPIRGRPNLHIETGALARALLLDGRRCVGVRYSVGDSINQAAAAREVVVSAGSINSPQLLELSGIGQPERLRAGDRSTSRAARRGENLRIITRPEPDGRSARKASLSTIGPADSASSGRRCAMRCSIKACWAWSPRRCARSSVPARDWKHRICFWAGCRC